MIGYYAHSQGSGHSNYATLLARSAVIIFTDYDREFPENVNVVRLDNEDVNGKELSNDETYLPPYLHHAPLGLRKITHRNLNLLTTVLQQNIQLLIVDVSAEIAALARVSSLPYAYRRMFGTRDDIPHRAAYKGALFLLAYYPEEFEDPETPAWIKDKTCYLGFIVQTETQQKITAATPKAYLTIIQGFGGQQNTDWVLQKALQTFPDKTILVVGPVAQNVQHPNIKYVGVVPSVAPYIKKSQILIASCGTNLVNDIMRQGKKFLAIPEDRPYEEQLNYAGLLQQKGIACRLTEENFEVTIIKAETFTHYQVPAHWLADQDRLYVQIRDYFHSIKEQLHAKHR
ncbi:MAG: glycosyltransferase [Leeuwenhoekiella sp.]